MRIARDARPASRWARPTCCARRWARRTPRSWPRSASASSAAAASAGCPRRRPRKIFDYIEYFAGYGFNKSHSTTYALLAYQTAYLKANYPRHFMAALLTIESQNTDKLALYLAECRELGVPVLPPDINVSQLPFTRRAGGGVRFGLGARSRTSARARSSRFSASRDARRPHRRRSMCSASTSTCGWSTSACSRAWSRPARSTRSTPDATGRRSRSPRGGRGCYAAIDRALDHGSRHQARPRAGAVAAVRRRRAATTAPTALTALPRRRPGREERGAARSRRRRSGSTSAAIRCSACRGRSRRPAPDRARTLATVQAAATAPWAASSAGCRHRQDQARATAWRSSCSRTRRQRRGRGLPGAFKQVRAR